MVRIRSGVQSSPSAQVYNQFMTSYIGRSIFLGILLITLIAGLFIVVLRSSDTGDSQSDTTIQATKDDTTPIFDVVLLKTDDNARRLISCQDKRCQTLAPPPSQGSSAVTDGQSWYHYQKGSLHRTWIADGKSQVIVDRTPLIASRDLIISPDNKKVAYWLDNVDQPEEQLTELWVFDSDQGGVKLLAEKLIQPAVVTTARWNKASSHLWFVGNDNKFNLISTQPPGIRPSFSNINWDKLKDIADHGIMDINLTGETIAYTEPTYLGRSKLVTASQGKKPRTSIVKNPIPYLQWLEDDRLLFVTQNSQDFTFWLLQGSNQQQIARHPGRLESVRTNSEGSYAIFASQPRENHTRLYALNITSGDIVNLNYQVPNFGDSTYLVHVEAKSDQPGDVAGLIEPLEDDQLVAFVENNLPEIVRQTNVQQKRLTITNKPNTMYVDYRDGTGVDKRLLLTVNDAVHTEWSVSAYYEESSGEWVRTQGGGLTDPKALRLYEWEEKLEQWILKEEY